MQVIIMRCLLQVHSAGACITCGTDTVRRALLPVLQRRVGQQCQDGAHPAAAGPGPHAQHDGGRADDEGHQRRWAQQATYMHLLASGALLYCCVRQQCQSRQPCSRWPCKQQPADEALPSTCMHSEGPSSPPQTGCVMLATSVSTSEAPGCTLVLRTPLLMPVSICLSSTVGADSHAPA
jgi:hypothetical protein